MGRVKVGRLELDPARCPAVLDTTTWDPRSAWDLLRSVSADLWRRLLSSPEGTVTSPGAPVLHPGSRASHRGAELTLASLPDGQDVFLQIGPDPLPRILGRPIGSFTVAELGRVAVHPADMPTLARYLAHVNPRKAPRALGSVPRLGIGDRHTVAVWPAAWRAMEVGGFAANAIQNWVRELNLLDDLRADRPARVNHVPGFGSLAEGHTGSTFEGLLHAGVLSALKSSTFPRYGADADHIQVKRGAEGLARARRVVEAARHYTFFTLDVSDLLGYEAMRATGPAACDFGRCTLGDPGWKDALRYHRGTRGPSAARIELELSIDETPAGTAAVEGITPPEAVAFLVAEIGRRHLPVTRLAPNFGVEKGVDYRCLGGLEELEARVRFISRIAPGRASRRTALPYIRVHLGGPARRGGTFREPGTPLRPLHRDAGGVRGTARALAAGDRGRPLRRRLSAGAGPPRSASPPARPLR